MKYFLLVYDRPRRELMADPLVFTDHGEALRARFEIERSSRNRDREVVVVSGESLESLKATHSRYFRGGEALTAS